MLNKPHKGKQDSANRELLTEPQTGLGWKGPGIFAVTAGQFVTWITGNNNQTQWFSRSALGPKVARTIFTEHWQARVKHENPLQNLLMLTACTKAGALESKSILK